MANKKRKKGSISFLKYIGITLVIVSLIMAGLIFFIDLLPLEYFLVLVVLLIIIDFILFKLLLAKKVILKIIGMIITLIVLTFLVLIINYELTTIDFFKQFGFNSYKTENYALVVLNDSNYKEINDLKNKKIAHLAVLNKPGLKEAIKKLENKIVFKDEVIEQSSDLINNLINKKIDAILIETSQLEILSEDDNETYLLLKTIDTIEIEIMIEKIGEEVNILKDSYNIYISGIDTYGSITKASRSDVNIIVSVNPKTNEILLTSIPRDYYVTLNGFNEKDKLTHAGIYGIETSVKTIEDLLDIKINYYVKVNFTSLIKVVDALGGITVNSLYNFTTIDGYTFKKGENKLDGEKALSFSRERKAFIEGDRTRGENQERVLSAIIDKAMSPAIIIKYNELINSLKGNFITNIDYNDIMDFIKEEIDNPRKWNISSISLDGDNGSEYTYSYNKNKLYVMIPNIDSVNEAKEKIKSVTTN